MRIAFFSAAVLLASCDPNSESAFTQGRSAVPCIQSINACPDQEAACTIDNTTFARRRFPDDSPFAFMVAAPPDHTIEVLLFFATEEDAGIDTRIFWYEPGCSDVYVYKSEGEDLFEEAEETNYVSRSQKIYEGGDHLIEIHSDLRADVLVTVDVIVPTYR